MLDQCISASQLTTVAVSAIIANAVLASRDTPNKWPIYEQAKRDIELLNLSGDEYEKVIQLLSNALGI